MTSAGANVDKKNVHDAKPLEYALINEWDEEVIGFLKGKAGPIPEDRKIRVKLDETVSSASLLMNGLLLSFQQNDQNLILLLPAEELDKIDTVVKLVLK